MSAKIVRTDGTDPRFVKLCEKLDLYLDELVGGRKQREQYLKYNTLEDIHDVILIMEDEKVVGE